MQPGSQPMDWQVMVGIEMTDRRSWRRTAITSASAQVVVNHHGNAGKDGDRQCNVRLFSGGFVGWPHEIDWWFHPTPPMNWNLLSSKASSAPPLDATVSSRTVSIGNTLVRCQIFNRSGKSPNLAIDHQFFAKQGLVLLHA